MPNQSSDHSQKKCTPPERGNRPPLPPSGSPSSTNDVLTPGKEGARVPASINDQALDLFLDNLDRETFQELIRCIEEAGYGVADGDDGQ